MKDPNVKSISNKLVIKKNKRVLDNNNQFNYVFEWYDNQTIVMKEILKISANEYNLPEESYDINELIDHKIDCCLDIDKSNFVVETVDL